MDGWVQIGKTPTDDITYLMDQIIEHIPAPQENKGNTQLLITSLDYSSFIGRIAIGRVHRGSVKENQNIMLCKRDGSIVKAK